MGAPWVNSRKLADQLNQIKLAGVYFRTQAFTPPFPNTREALFSLLLFFDNAQLYHPRRARHKHERTYEAEYEIGKMLLADIPHISLG